MRNLAFSVFPSKNFVDLGVFQFGKEPYSPGQSAKPVTTKHFLFYYLMSGDGTFVVDDPEWKAQKHHIKCDHGIMIFPGQTCTFTADKDCSCEYLWIEIDGLRLKEILDMAGITRFAPEYHAWRKEMRDSMANEIIYIMENTDSSPLHLIGHLYLFLDYLTRSASELRVSSGNHRLDTYIHNALEYIEHNYQKSITMEEVAEVCGLNRVYLGRIFKESIGQPPQHYLLTFRMAKAKELLKTTNLPIKEISWQVGYENPLHFSRAFKDLCGISPKEWRNENKFKK